MPEAAPPSLFLRLLKFAFIALLAAGAAALGMYRYKAASGYTTASRGERTAAKLGCFNCHGAGGEGGVANPGSSEKTVPAWTGGTAMMYLKAPGELDEWVLDGKPKRLRESKEPADDSPLLDMPAYRGKISGRDFRNLKIYLRAVMALDIPDEKDKAAHEGFLVAQKTGCFGCHGASGRGVRSNPRSLAGYIPAWEGPVYGDLVKDDKELEEWIREGGTARMKKNKFANYFIQRQVIAMPPYDGVLSDEEIASVIAYIKWLRAQPAEN
jgi:cytochrome c553